VRIPNRSDIKVSCPSCGRSFSHGIPFMEHATVVYRRTCQNPDCREKWNLVVKPLGGKPKQYFAHEVTFAFLGVKE